DGHGPVEPDAQVAGGALDRSRAHAGRVSTGDVGREDVNDGFHQPTMLAASPLTVPGRLHASIGPGTLGRQVPVDWRATIRWQDQLQEGDEVVGAIRGAR